MRISAPGKTFLVGEYLALRGGPSLLAATSPRFALETDGASSASPFHPASPAGRLLAARGIDAANWAFADPHEGRGGLGASTAQYLCAWTALRGRPPFGDWRALVEEYRGYAWDGSGAAPSGADLVAQACGRLTVYDGAVAAAHSMDWPFPDLAFTLLRTGRKLATHEALRAGASFDEAALRAAAETATTALESGDGELFVSAVNAYGAGLRAAGLLARPSADLLRAIGEGSERHGFGVRASKGCGAMGADVLLLVHKASESARLGAWCAERGLAVCGGDMELSLGVRIDVRTDE